VCARIGNQWSCGVVTARIQTDAVRSLRHQCRDLHQSTYLVPLRRSGLILLTGGIRFWVSCAYTYVSFCLFPEFILRSTEKAKKNHIFCCHITLGAANVSVTLLNLCSSWLSLVAG
jgi:hypothetical protein